MTRQTFATRLVRLTRLSNMMMALVLLGLAGALVRTFDAGPAQLLMAAEFATGALTGGLVLAALGALISLDDSSRPPRTPGRRLATWKVAIIRAANLAFVFVMAAVDPTTAAVAGIAYAVFLLGIAADQNRAQTMPDARDYAALLVAVETPQIEHCTRLKADSLDDALAAARTLKPDDAMSAFRLVALSPAADADRVMLESGETLGERLRCADLASEDAARIDAPRTDAPRTNAEA